MQRYAKYVSIQKMQNQTNLTEHTKQILPKQAYQTKPNET